LAVVVVMAPAAGAVVADPPTVWFSASAAAFASPLTSNMAKLK
jgi:hypothetical protein